MCFDVEEVVPPLGLGVLVLLTVLLLLPLIVTVPGLVPCWPVILPLP